jgi:hypothetical protein
LLLNCGNFVYGYAIGLFTNEGTVNVGAGLSVNDTLQFDNTGTINLASGSSLAIKNPDTAGVVASGTYHVGAGASLTFSSSHRDRAPHKFAVKISGFLDRNGRQWQLGRGQL